MGDDNWIDDEGVEGDFSVNLERKDKIIEKIFPTLIKTTYYVYGFLLLIWIADIVALFWDEIKPHERLINDKVIMALIGATTIQVGSSAFAIVNGLFKK